MKITFIFFLMCFLAMASVGCQANFAFSYTVSGTYEDGAPSNQTVGANGLALCACTVDAIYTATNFLNEPKAGDFEWTTTAVISQGFTILATGQTDTLKQNVMIPALSEWNFGSVHDEAVALVYLPKGNYVAGGSAYISEGKTGDDMNDQLAAEAFKVN